MTQCNFPKLAKKNPKDPSPRRSHGVRAVPSLHNKFSGDEEPLRLRPSAQTSTGATGAQPQKGIAGRHSADTRQTLGSPCRDAPVQQRRLIGDMCAPECAALGERAPARAGRQARSCLSSVKTRKTPNIRFNSPDPESLILSD
ncbi:hypothetical protein ATANTOWER_015467 [Ataeniobius toweri]|uniref:Uncharacterized protein n=1 Tax=Ataeniobius toweri TaxID=208326 RepID=A0ABU7B0A2_9TELE|nr:hypothetical protein [Ataeniobius toweri]